MGMSVEKRERSHPIYLRTFGQKKRIQNTAEKKAKNTPKTDKKG
jgi:hypothetical protein